MSPSAEAEIAGLSIRIMRESLRKATADADAAELLKRKATAEAESAEMIRDHARISLGLLPVSKTIEVKS